MGLSFRDACARRLTEATVGEGEARRGTSSASEWNLDRGEQRLLASLLLAGQQ